MAVREILKMGNPQLLQVSEPVADSEISELEDLVTDLIDTMTAAEGAGLAAPQIGVMKRVVIFGFEHNERYPDAGSVPFTVLINPELEVLDNQVQYGWEGCLSVPGMRGKVPRAHNLRYRGFTLDSSPIDRTVDGFHARVVQHECDHLDGILYPMRMEDMRYFGFEDQLRDMASSCPAQSTTA
ncbi:MAG: peptide deformylase [Gammaproteobacteria bacterium]|nr:peptide deformylase [Gammaproteobacteria bacterium]